MGHPPVSARSIVRPVDRAREHKEHRIVRRRSACRRRAAFASAHRAPRCSPRCSPPLCHRDRSVLAVASMVLLCAPPQSLALLCAPPTHTLVAAPPRATCCRWWRLASWADRRVRAPLLLALPYVSLCHPSPEHGSVCLASPRRSKTRTTSSRRAGLTLLLPSTSRRSLGCARARLRGHARLRHAPEPRSRLRSCLWWTVCEDGLRRRRAGEGGRHGRNSPNGSTPDVHPPSSETRT